MKKLISLLLVLVLCVSLFGTSAFAEGGERSADKASGRGQPHES